MKSVTRLPRLAVACFTVVAAAVAAFPALAQPLPNVPSGDSESAIRRLKIQLDRKTARVYEPIYLCLTAEQFVAGVDPEVMIRKGADGQWKPVQIAQRQWEKSEAPRIGSIPLQRRGTILQLEDLNGHRRWLFPEPGDYNIRVKVGDDATTLNLKVAASDQAEKDAWTLIVDRLGDILQNNFADTPEQGTLDACASVIRRYPNTMCAAYCQSYISITKFKVLFEKNAKSGGKPVYGDVADELAKVADRFRESYFGEMTAFYACYAKGLSKEYDQLINIADAMQTHLTLWADATMSMKIEVIQHIGPRVIPVDPDKPLPTTKPAGAGTAAATKP
jgi:hypothetical protein